MTQYRPAAAQAGSALWDLVVVVVWVPLPESSNTWQDGDLAGADACVAGATEAHMTRSLMHAACLIAKECAQ